MMEWIITKVALKTTGYRENRKVVGITVSAEQKDAFVNSQGVYEYADADLEIDLSGEWADRMIVGATLTIQLVPQKK